MSFVWSLIEIILVILILLTAAYEPAATFQYGKAMVVTVVKIVNFSLKHANDKPVTISSNQSKVPS